VIHRSSGTAVNTVRGMGFVQVPRSDLHTDDEPQCATASHKPVLGGKCCFVPQGKKSFSEISINLVTFLH
jgi:hypothetical protein